MPRPLRKGKLEEKVEKEPQLEIAPSGTPVLFAVCPLCARNRPLELKSESSIAKGKAGPIRWDFWDKETSPLIQIRVGGGKNPGKGSYRYPGSARGKGFKTVETIDWETAKIQYPELVEAIKSQVAKLAKELLV